MSTQKQDVSYPSATRIVDHLCATDALDSSLDHLQEWDPVWAEQYLQMATNPWQNGVLDVKTIELICIGLNAACTNLQPNGTRRHIRAALKAGATRNEILMILKMASVISIHSCSLGAPILLEEAKAGVEPMPKQAGDGVLLFWGAYSGGRTGCF